MSSSLIVISEYLKQKDSVLIGRAKNCDIRLDSEYVSRQHCLISKGKDGFYYIEDLGSRNGTYVNQNKINKKTKIDTGDEIIIGFYLFTLNRPLVNLQLLPVISFKDVSIGTPDKEIIKPFHLQINQSEFWVIMGPSGSGKSTFVKSIIGDMLLKSGILEVHGLDIRQYGKFIQSKIGYVSQFDVLHTELTVYENLFYNLKIRYGENISNREMKEKILWALEKVNLKNEELIHKQVKHLSGGQIKRVSIAMELMNTPSILILDEATSPLDPETIKEFMSCLKEIQKQGTTILLVTHKPDDLSYANNVLFIGIDGFPLYAGNKNDILKSFNLNNIHELYELATDRQRVENYYETNFRKKETSLSPNTDLLAITEKQKEKGLPNVGRILSVFFWLLVRGFHIKIKSGWMYWGLIISQPLLIGGLIYLMFPKIMLGVLFILVLSCIWFGVSNSAREIVDELHIFRKEYKFGISIHSYLFSKMVVISVLTFLQCFLIVFVLHKFYQQDYIHLNSYQNTILHAGMIGLSAVLLGLFISSLFRTSEQVMSIVPLTLIPQIMLNGILSDLDTKEKELLSYTTISRWGTELVCIEQDRASTLYEYNTVLYSPQYDTVYKVIYPCKNLYYLYCAGCDKVRLKIPKKINVSYQSHTESKKLSLYSYRPSIIKDTLIVKENAQDTLPKISETKELSYTNALISSGFYKFNGPNHDENIKDKYKALLIINLITYLLIYISLKFRLRNI